MGLPKGMTKPVVKLWPAIDKYVTKELKRIGEKVGKSAIGHLDPRSDHLGQGAWGSVYPTTSPRWVVKLTADPTEGPITQAIMNKPSLREHIGISYFLKLWRLGEIAKFHKKAYPIYVVLRENIKPYKPVYWGRRDRDVARAEHLLVGTKETEHGLRGIADGLNAAILAHDSRAAEIYGADLGGALMELENIYPSHQIAAFMWEFFEDLGGALADVHLGNFGYRKHYLNDLKLPKEVKVSHDPSEYWVIFDPGHSSVATRKQPPIMPLKNPGRPIPIIR